MDLPPTGLKCDRCGSLFARRRELSRHYHTHTKPHTCHACGKGFALRADLNRHKSTHKVVDQDFRYYCSHHGCALKGFKRPDNLRRHMRMEHGGQEDHLLFIESLKHQKQHQNQSNRGLELISAVYAGNCNMVEWMITDGADIGFKPDIGKIALNAAAINDTTELVRLSLQKGPVIEVDKNGFSAIADALKSQRHDVVHLLIDHCADIDLRGRFGHALLHRFVFEKWPGDGVEITRKLIERGANIWGYGLFVYGALITAVSLGLEAIVKTMVDYWPDDGRSEGRKTLALMVACRKGFLQIARELIRWGANISGEFEVREIDEIREVSNFRGFRMTPLGEACTEGHVDLVQLLLGQAADIYSEVNLTCWLDVVLPSIDRGARVIKDKYTYVVPLSAASARGQTSIVRFLLQSGADTNSKFSALRAASRSGHIEIVRLLLQNGAGVNAISVYTVTSLQLASQNGHFEIAELLVRNGADVNFTNRGGSRPLSLAKRKGHDRIARLLLDHGAKR